MKSIKSIFVILLTVILVLSCTQKFTGKPEIITIAGDYEKINELIPIIEKYQQKYPQYLIEYECIDNYNKNLEKKLSSPQVNQPHLFFTNAIKDGSPLAAYALDLADVKNKVDYSKTSPEVTKNYVSNDHLYAIPLACTVRGVLVNRTLVKNVYGRIPKNQTELLEAFQKLSYKGYKPIYSTKNEVGQMLLYPWFCNIVAHNKENWNKVNDCKTGVGEVFIEPISFFYDVLLNEYVNYKALNAEFEKNVELFLCGQIPYLLCTIDEAEVYKKYSHTNETFQDEPFIFTFDCTPVAKEGSYGYISPWRGISINKNCKNIEAAIKFLNFLLQHKQLEMFALEKSLIPNTRTMNSIIKKTFSIPEKNICNVGQATFPFSFYGDVKNLLIEMTNEIKPSKNNLPSKQDYINRLEGKLLLHK